MAELYEINVYGDLSTQSFNFATLLAYAGFAIFACESGNPPTWKFRQVKKFDAESYASDVESDQTSVMLVHYRKAEALCKRVEKMTRNSVEGFRSKCGWYVGSEER